MTISHKKGSRVTVSGSNRLPLRAAMAVGQVPDDERFEVTVRVRRKVPLDVSAHLACHTNQLPAERQYLSHDQYAAAYGADVADMAKVEAFAREHGLVVVESNPARRSVFLSGTAADFAAAFATKIEQYEHDGGTYRGRIGELTVPGELDGIIEGVFGIDNRPAAQPHFQQYNPIPSFGIAAHAANVSYTPPQLAKLYNFPTDLDGTGQCIAIIELGGGYRKADIKKYFQQLGLAVPHVKTARVDGANNSSSAANSADGEVMLDIAVAATMAFIRPKPVGTLARGGAKWYSFVANS
jgi:kumamolisin